MKLGPPAARALQALARELITTRADHPFAAAATRRHRVLASAAYWGFLVALVFSVVTAFGFNFNFVSHARWAGWARVGVGAVLIAEGLVIAVDWQGARRLVLRRLYDRVHGADDRRPPRLRLWLWRVFAPALVVIGAVWVALGSFELAQGLRTLI
jgi:hypothetical protein